MYIFNKHNKTLAATFSVEAGFPVFARTFLAEHSRQPGIGTAALQCPAYLEFGEPHVDLIRAERSVNKDDSTSTGIVHKYATTGQM